MKTLFAIVIMVAFLIFYGILGGHIASFGMCVTVMFMGLPMWGMALALTLITITLGTMLSFL